MTHLRSTSSHNLGADFHALRRFAATDPQFGPEDLIGRYRRPSLRLFRAHAKHLLREYQLPELQVRARVTGMSRKPAGYELETDQGTLQARNVVLALGNGDRLRWPRRPGDGERGDLGASSVDHTGPWLQHLYQQEFVEPEPNQSLLVIGGGIGALQFACSRAAHRVASGHTGRVTVLHPDPLKLGHFDAEACFMGPACMDAVRLLPITERHRIIDSGRRPGRVPPDLAAQYRDALSDGLLSHRAGRVLEVRDGARVILEDGSELRAEAVVAATGFHGAGPGPELLGHIGSELGLSCSQRGYPLIGADLRWDAGLFVAGPAAELELGPMAGNLLGAMHAARRILAV